MSGWQPIETAPKDGTEVVLYDPTDGVTWVGYYETDKADWFEGAGVYEVYPSHWMPLPEPPE